MGVFPQGVNLPPVSRLDDHDKRFAYAEATEGSSYTNPYFATQYVG